MTRLLEILGSKSKVDLDFVDLLQDEAQDGSPIVRLVLKEPLAAAYGRRVNDEVSGDTVTLTANDVEIVSIGAEALEEIDKLEKEGKDVFTWDVEGKSGKLSCNLKLDVSRSREVWIVKTSLAAWGRNQRNERRSRQNSNLVKKIRENNTKKEFATIDVNAHIPEPVGGAN